MRICNTCQSPSWCWESWLASSCSACGSQRRPTATSRHGGARNRCQVCWDIERPLEHSAYLPLTHHWCDLTVLVTGSSLIQPGSTSEYLSHREVVLDQLTYYNNPSSPYQLFCFTENDETELQHLWWSGTEPSVLCPKLFLHQKTAAKVLTPGTN